VTGTFSDPKVAPDMGKLAAKGVGAIVMGIINPVLAILPLFKEGKKEESNCAALIAHATGAGGASAGATAKKPAATTRKPAATPR
jgi:hypothetical protein